MCGNIYASNFFLGRPVLIVGHMVFIIYYIAPISILQDLSTLYIDIEISDGNKQMYCISTAFQNFSSI